MHDKEWAQLLEYLRQDPEVRSPERMLRILKRETEDPRTTRFWRRAQEREEAAAPPSEGVQSPPSTRRYIVDPKTGWSGWVERKNPLCDAIAEWNAEHDTQTKREKAWRSHPLKGILSRMLSDEMAKRSKGDDHASGSHGNGSGSDVGNGVRLRAGSWPSGGA